MKACDFSVFVESLVALVFQNPHACGVPAGEGDFGNSTPTLRIHR